MMPFEMLHAIGPQCDAGAKVCRMSPPPDFRLLIIGHPKPAGGAFHGPSAGQAHQPGSRGLPAAPPPRSAPGDKPPAAIPEF
jgi:hypothetical protein